MKFLRRLFCTKISSTQLNAWCQTKSSSAKTCYSVRFMFPTFSRTRINLFFYSDFGYRNKRHFEWTMSLNGFNETMSDAVNFIAF